MRGVVLMLVMLALVVGCGKRGADTNSTPPGQAFADNSMEHTLKWLASQKNAIDSSVKPGDEAATKEANEKFRALAETMKGRSITWDCELASLNSDKTCVVLPHRLQTDPPEPPGETTRARHYAIVCKPFEPGRPILENDPFPRKLDAGFPANPSNTDWLRTAKAGMPVKLTGTIEAVQLHNSSSVTGLGIKDRVVRTEVAFTLHITGGTLSPKSP
ncbi:MAG: hypothetical protein L0241_06075 [Planctomycetia bacterium]|nr:hypothetical protein [Planctomycetia bacterium]